VSLRGPIVLLLAALLLPAPASAGDVALRGHIKAFFVGTFPYRHLIMPEDPIGSATLNARLVFEARPAEGLLLEVHPQINASIGSGGFSGLSTGVGRTAPEALPMTVEVTEGDAFKTTFRIDRANMSWTRGPVRFTAGRQPMTFGQGLIFTPLDLVAPFTPTTLDTSYKPGVDSFRADIFLGMSGRITGLAAYLGEWGPEGSAFVLQGQGTIVTVDVGGFVGVLYGDPVFGLSVYAPIGPIGLYGDLALTIDDDDPEFRGVVGLLSRPGPTTSLSVEVYGQTFGSTDASDYLVINTGERFSRGELWLAGHLYAAAVLGQEITPLLQLSVALIGNLMDPSVLLSPTLAWSIASNADLSFGAQIGIGERPAEVELIDLIDDDTGLPLAGDDLLRAMNIKSEFGLLPVTAFVQGGFHF
jgi:hypothetical protein